MSDEPDRDYSDPATPEEIARDEREALAAKGPLAWFARNSVAANVLMIILVIGGLAKLRTIKQEVFPEINLDFVMVQLMYPGAGPEEVERGAILVVEEVIRGMDGIRDITSTSREGFGVVTVQLKSGEDAQQRLNEIKAEVDRITSFPQDMERPNVFLAARKIDVISLIVHGPESEKVLRALAEEFREELLTDSRVSMADFAGAREYEISVEISQENLRRYGLTLDGVAQLIRSSVIELPGGGVKTERGEVLIRTTERRLVGQDFEEITLIARPDGTIVTVGDIATVRDGFKEIEQTLRYNGEPAALLRVFRVGEETPIDVAAAVKELVDRHAASLPPGISLAVWMDMSLIYEQRIDLLSRNALMGLVLVILVLGLFLDVKLAFWVTLGIPISFCGAFLFLPSTDVSVNMISLFAFIQVLGMVVDDAIVVGEAAYLRRQQGMKPLAAAIAGVKEVAMPVTFAIITTIVMYVPMLMIPGIMGKFMRAIPVVVITVLILSLIESMLVLPAHLAHTRQNRATGVFAWIGRYQQAFSSRFERFVAQIYAPFLKRAVLHRYMTMAVAFAVLIGSIGLLAGGRIRRIDMPDIDSDVVICAARLPYGSSMERALVVEAEINAAANRLIEDNGGKDKMMVGMFSQIGRHAMTAKSDMGGASAFDRGAHLIEIAIYMVPSDQRAIRAAEMARQWREALQDTVGLESLSFSYAMGPGSGPPVHVNLSHPNYETLKVAAADLAQQLTLFEGTYDVNDGYEPGKEQLDFELTAQARSLGVSEGSLASQLRAAFFGAEAVRQQRGRDEVRTYVRLPRSERESEYNIEEFLIRTPEGGEIPLAEAATIERGTSYTQINRYNGLRVLAVTAMVDPAAADPKKVNTDVLTTLVPELMAKYPGLSFTVGGAEKEMSEANEGLITGFMLALLGVYALLAIAFRSYMQPILIMLAIPFGFVGALWGHYVMGHDFSMMSMMGVVALAGIVVNDSLILIVAINDNRAKGMSMIDAIVTGGVRRFRPILLTSLTTFFGLMPMLLETEVQAQFLAPMAVSLGFGVMAATGITLVLVPASYYILQDCKSKAHMLGELAGLLDGKPPPTRDVDADELDRQLPATPRDSSEG